MTALKKQLCKNLVLRKINKFKLRETIFLGNPFHNYMNMIVHE